MHIKNRIYTILRIEFAFCIVHNMKFSLQSIKYLIKFGGVYFERQRIEISQYVIDSDYVTDSMWRFRREERRYKDRR